MRRFALALIAVTALAGSAHAADIGNKVKSSANSLANPDATPNVADLINASRADGLPPVGLENSEANADDSLFIGSESDGGGSYSLKVQKKLLEF
ncbi:MAG: hypothetical protein Q7T44_08840 [Parvibaculum sp.]|nr:hypothetical protein [Parvibaculum sp.]